MNKFDDMMKNRDPAIQLAAEEARWEEALVKHLVRQFNLGAGVRRKLAKIWYDRHRAHALKLTAFNDVFSTFPFLLGASRLGGKHVHRDIDAAEPARFKAFSQVSFVEAYREFYDDCYHPEDLRKLGLVFPRKGFKHGMIIHNDDTEVFWTSGLCWVYKSKKGERLYVQPFNDVLNQVKKSRTWRPEEI